MKTQIKRFSKSALAVVLTLCMLVSCMTVGIIATDAARWKQTDSSYVFTKNTTIYVQASTSDSWGKDGAVFYIKWAYNKDDWYSSDYTAMTKVSDGLYSATVPNNDWIRAFAVDRRSSGNSHWNGPVWAFANDMSSDTQNLLTISGWPSDGSTVNSWSLYTPPETTYSVSVSAGTGGTVASPSVNAGNTTAVKLPTATPNPGYDFNKWTATSPATISSGSTSADGGYVKASGTGGSVTASFTPKANMYLSGWINGAAVDVNNSNYKFTKNSDTNYTLSFTATGDCYVTLNDGTTAYHPTNNNSASGAAVDASKNTGYNDDPKWYIAVTNGYTVTVTWNPSTQKVSWTTAAPVSYDITYSGSNVTWGSGKPTSAHAGETVSFTVSASSGYRVSQVKYNDGSDHILTASNGTYSFTMPAKAVTVTSTTVKTYTVTLLAAGTGMGSTKQYFVGTTPGTYSNYSSAVTVDAGSTVYFKVSYATGYEYDTVTNATVYTANTVFKTAAINANTTVTITAKKISWSGLTAVGKYSTTAANDASYSNDFPAGTAPNVTIAATSATQLDGVAVTAPGTDPTGYVFAGWYTTTGSFANPANKDTTFYPNAANAVAIAKYKKIFTITSSVDSTGTGAGTVSTSVATVEAGGSYTITATAASHSAVESVKVNGTAKTATASQTISSVSADQTVVVKFKSNVYLKGTMNSTAWAGDVMTANTAGTSYTIANVVLNAGTVYEFKHFVDSGSGVWNNTAPATWTLNGIATHGTKDDGNGSTNLTITPSVKAKVTFVSDGTKFTSITAIPYDSTTYNVTLTQSDDYTITSTYMGVEYTTSGKSANVTVSVYSGTEFSYTVTPASGKYLSAVAQSESVALSPAFVTATHANSYTGTVSSVSKAFAVSATAANTLSITAKSNKSDRGTVQVDAVGGKAYPGQIVKVTVTPKNGVLKSLTVKDASGTDVTLRDSVQTSSLNYSQLDVATVTALMYDFFNKSGEALGATANDEALGADTVKYFTMPESAVTVNATFDSYSAESTWYYNGYDTSGNAVSGYHTKQMTEAMVGGEKFSYYEVSGRTGTDQLMTVSNGAASSGTRYVYFTASAEGGWSTDENHQYAYFYNTSGAAGNAWPGYKMTKYTTNDYGQKVYRVEIPTSSSPTGVVFNNSTYSPHQTTNVTDLSKGGYYLLNTSHWDDTLQKTIHDWQSYDCTYPSAGYSTGTEYFYKESTHNGDYTGDFNTKGFNNHNTASKEFAKPKDLGTNTGDYYINVLYPNTTYTINGVTKKTGSNPMIIWSAEPLAGDDEAVKIYAKDGAIRAETFGSTYANIADTKIYAADGTTTVGTKHNGSITNQTYETYKAAKGDTIVIKTTIGATDSSTLSNAADLKAKYYVRGFCVNGEVSQLLEPNDTGVYTLTYKVPEDYEGKNIEITPIYYLKDTEANPIVTYRVTGFTDELKAVGSGKPGWGDTLYTYPFYGKLGGQNNAFGAYPGQPMVYYKGQYQMQIPQKSTAWDPYQESAATVNSTNVAGVTMSNGYWDSVHKTIMGYGDNSSSADHVQTYDYGDFYKIFNEKKPVDNIVFDFKYRTKKHNFENQPGTTITKTNLDSNYGTNGNGFELLTNFHGRNVDLFGTPLSGAASDPEQTTPVYVVSIGGVNGSAGVENIAGYYATEWMVYGSSNGSNYSRISAGGKNSIPPEVLVLNDDDDTSFNKTTYPSADANHDVTNWKALYTALEAYRGKPVMISYEAADAQQGQGMYYTGTGGATRNDGRWLYSKNGENITSNIKIQYSDDNGKTYTDLNTTAPQVTGLSAYFTNDGVEGQMTYSTTIDPDKTFDFEAKTANADYKFVGWFMEDGTKITTDNSSHTERSGSYTFVAKFMQVTTGQLMLSHIVEPNNIGETIYDGTGTATIAAVVKNGEGEIVRTFDATTSDIILDDKIIKSDNSAYTIEVTLTSTRGTNSGFVGESTMLKTPSDQSGKFFNYGSYDTSADGYTHTFNLSFTVGDLFSDITQQYKHIVYQSYFQKYVFNYTVNYEFKDRFGNKKIYNRAGTLTAAQAEKYVYKKTVGNDELRYIKKEFFEKLAPYESNFQQNLSWNISDTWFTEGTNYVYNCNAHYSAIPSDTDNKVNVTFVLPYVHDNGVATLNNGVGTAATATNFELINDGTNDNRVAFATIPKLTGGRTNGIYSADDGEKQYWIAAPAKLDTGDFFSHWSIKTTDSEVEVARCYFPGFNFLAYENYVIEAVYGSVESDVSTSGIYTNATYLSTTRNQWNALNSSTAAVPDVDKTDRATAADVLYNDFVLNYHYKDVNIYKNDSTSNDISELGIVVERVKELDKNSDDSYDTRISSYTSLAENTTNVTTVANDSTVKDGGSKKIGDLTYYKQRINKNQLDNKNRILFYEAFYNAAGWDSKNQKPAGNYTAKRYVYRAYTYIKYNDNGVEKIAISETPAYFVMYDVATANYSSN